MRIDNIIARSIPDTRGRATIDTTIQAGAFRANASVPSGKSTGTHEAIELRDPDDGVAHAIENVNNEIAGELAGRDFNSLDELDAFLIELDGTRDKSRLGANAILSVSIAAMRLFAQIEGVPLWRAISMRAKEEKFLRSKMHRSEPPHLFVNMMNGGAHADFKLPFQEYLLVIDGATSAAYPIVQEAFAKLGERLKNVSMGDEGGYAPTFDTLEEPFELLAELVEEFPNTSIAIDAAASELFHDDSYKLLGTSYSAEGLSRIYESLVARFPIRSIEDPFDEEAGDDFARLTNKIGATTLIVGDDLTVTNSARITHAIGRKEINAVLIKPNQIGTVRETIQAVLETHAAGLKTIVSHRSGETNDTFIADFAYGIGAYGIKTGGLGQKERLVKYERLLAIETENKTL